MFASGLLNPTLIPSFAAGIATLALMALSIRKLAGATEEANRPRYRTLHKVKWAAFATCCSVALVKSSVRIWYIATGQGSAFVDVSWWKHLWIIFVLWALVSAGATVYLRWADRPFPPGHCQSCGYPLRGNVSGVCPECGTSTSP